MKVLIVEDNPDLAYNMVSYLRQDGYVVEFTGTVKAGIEKLYAFKYDVLILDLMLPDGNGDVILQESTKIAPDMGVLIISAKNSLDDKLSGLNKGADDYISKPFHLAELNARLKAIYRRRNKQNSSEIIHNEIILNPDLFEVKVNDKSLELTKKEFELLHYLVINKNRLLTKQNIAEHLWGDYVDAGDSFDFVYQHIKNLRKKISDAGGGDYLKTVYGAGYKMSS
jgi:DNA-binding response OmpR family regulator